jgi:hypothetical protein
MDEKAGFPGLSIWSRRGYSIQVDGAKVVITEASIKRKIKALSTGDVPQFEARHFSWRGNAGIWPQRKRFRLRFRSGMCARAPLGLWLLPARLLKSYDCAY